MITWEPGEKLRRLQQHLIPGIITIINGLKNKQTVMQTRMERDVDEQESVSMD